MTDIKLKTDNTGVGVTLHSRVFKGSFVVNSDISCEEIQGISETLINIKDCVDSIAVIVDEEIDYLDPIENVVEMEIDNADGSEEEDEEEFSFILSKQNYTHVDMTQPWI